MKPAITMMLRIDSLGADTFEKSFKLLDDGFYLIDANGDVWYLIDRDGIHVVYAKDLREFFDDEGRGN